MSILVPNILIQSQTTFDGADIADCKFTISDTQTYYNHQPLIDTVCGIYKANPDQIKETIFQKCCNEISLYPVLRGEGKTAFDKAMFLFKQESQEFQDSVGFYQFYYNNLILYAMSKYILSYILYGKFNIKYLLQKYNEQFFIDLGMSRFCGAIKIFNDDQNLGCYNKYFKC